jgi:hypothetical protein
MLYIAFTLLILWLWHYTLLRQDMAVNQNERLSHITLRNKLKQTNKVSIAVLQTATDNLEYITYLLPLSFDLRLLITPLLSSNHS